MKTLLTLLIAGIIVIPAFAQDDSSFTSNPEIVSVSESTENTDVSVGPEETIVIDENRDTTRIKVGKKGIVIIEGDKGTQVNIENIEKNENNEAENDDEMQEDNDKKDSKFKPHWSGFDVGLNNYVDIKGSMNLDNSMSFMDLNTGRSWNFNLNFMQYGFGLGTDKIGLVTGLGAEWNNYHFDNNNSIQKDTNGDIISNPITYPDVQKNRLQTTYLRAPLLLEFQIPAGKKRVYLSAGPVAGVKLFSNTKIVYKENGDKQKVKYRDDYNLSPIRYGFTARAGYRGLRIFANYYMSPLFESGKNPEIYPFSVGLTLLDF